MEHVTPGLSGRIPVSMEIQFYNTLTHRVETFEPLTPGVVRMYNCGPTVYDFAHIGNFRSFIFADLLRRFLEFTGYEVRQVMNITDVGHMTDDQLADGAGRDKMELAAERLKVAKKQGRAEVANPDDPYQAAEYFIGVFLEDAKLLRLKVADEFPQRMPRATNNIDGMIRLIGRLITTSHAYVGSDGAVYYDVTTFPEYGRLSGNTLDKLQAGAGGRIAPHELAAKRHPHDFLLWKRDSKHLMRWPSPWGDGYPGWHIECSVMAMETHGAETLDIHTGGEDTIFPHHECEIAQSSGATGKPFATYWLHARYLLVDGEKMSKTKGNFYTVRDLLARNVDPAVLRYELLRTHYRSNANFTIKGLEDSEKAVRRLREFAGPQPGGKSAAHPGNSAIESAFSDALADDLNISAALGELFKWMHATPHPTDADRAALRRIDSVLGVLDETAIAVSGAQAGAGPSDADIDARCRQIDEARSRKDFARSDALRDALAAEGLEVQITREGTKWRRKMRVDSET